ncbi:hypothetical protein NUACC21_58330 [Scytonema sp. NUACC21]
MNDKLTYRWAILPIQLRFLIITLLVLGIFFRFFNLDGKVFWQDEVFTSLRSSGYSTEEIVKESFDGRLLGIEDLQKYQYLSPEKSLIDTINALKKAPEHPPLYYLMVRFWNQLFSHSVTPRALSAFISLLVFPCIYWLCLELFESPLIGWIAVILTAVSPIHVLYAQEARQYSLWTVAVLLSSASLLRAIRIHTKLNWGIYATTLSLGFYSHLLSTLIAIGHGIYVFAINRFQLNKTTAAYLLALLTGLIAFTPWLFVINSFQTIENRNNWMLTPVLMSNLVKSWGSHLNCIFFDFNLSQDHPFTYLILCFILGLTGYSIYFLYNSASFKVCLFLCLLIGLVPIALIIPDLIWGGMRSVSSRYFIPFFLGIQLSVAYLLSMKIFGIHFLQQKLWRGIMVLLISGGLASCIVSSQANSWWIKSISFHNPQIAAIINKATKPLLISNEGGNNLGNVISLSYLLEPKVKFQLVVEPNIPNLPDGFSDIFVLSPSPTLQQGLEKKYQAKLTPIESTSEPRLWKLNLTN